MTEAKQIEEVIASLRDAQKRLSRKQKWSAFNIIGHARTALYFIESDLAHQSIKAAKRWGCAIRFHDGKTYILDDRPK